MKNNKIIENKDISSLLEDGGVSLEKFSNEMNGGFYKSFEEIPEEYRYCLLKDESGEENYDYNSFIINKKNWVIESLEHFQPHSFRVLKDKSGPLLLGIRLIGDPLRPHLAPNPNPYLFFNVCGRMIEVRPNFAGCNYEDGDDCFGSLQSIPEELAKSWLWRTDGWRIPSELPEYVMTNRQLIGHPSAGWKDTDDYLDSLGRGWKKKYLSKIVERFPDTATNINGIKRYKFRCFLDTRPSNINGPVGDQFFVCSTRQDKIVYHIHRGDVENIRILHNPAEAIDRYCAHTLLRTPSEFDFMPWSEPMPA